MVEIAALFGLVIAVIWRLFRCVQRHHHQLGRLIPQYCSHLICMAPHALWRALRNLECDGEDWLKSGIQLKLLVVIISPFSCLWKKPERYLFVCFVAVL